MLCSTSSRPKNIKQKNIKPKNPSKLKIEIEICNLSSTNSTPINSAKISSVSSFSSRASSRSYSTHSEYSEYSRNSISPPRTPPPTPTSNLISIPISPPTSTPVNYLEPVINRHTYMYHDIEFFPPNKKNLQKKITNNYK